MSTRRNVNPAARRRAVAAVVLVAVLVGAMFGVAEALSPSARTDVPGFVGLKPASASARAGKAGLHLTYGARQYSHRPVGEVVSQRPSRGRRVSQGTTVTVVLSKGPAPVEVPLVVKEDDADARAQLAHLGLHTRIATVAAPGIAAGTVVRQSPSPGQGVRPASIVELWEAEVPRWRAPLTTFTGGESAPFRIRGTRWRIVYRTSYSGVCAWLSLFCSGPTARIANLSTGATTSLGLNEGEGNVQTFTSGPGQYQIKVLPGSDASWSVSVEDYY